MKKQLTAVAGINPSQDIIQIDGKFSVEAELVLLDAKKWFMAALKDTDDNAVCASSSTPMTSSTKKEPVRLPSFEGALILGRNLLINTMKVGDHRSFLITLMTQHVGSLLHMRVITQKP